MLDLGCFFYSSQQLLAQIQQCKNIHLQQIENELLSKFRKHKNEDPSKLFTREVVVDETYKSTYVCTAIVRIHASHFHDYSEQQLMHPNCYKIYEFDVELQSFMHLGASRIRSCCTSSE